MKTVVIVHPSEILRKGVESILIAGSVEHFYQFENFTQLMEHQIVKGDHYYLYVDVLLLNESFLRWFRQQNKGRFLLMGIGDQNEIDLKSKPYFADFINISSDGDKVLKTLDIPFRSDKSSDVFLKPDEELSQRELEVLQLVAVGYSNKDIAEKLFISAHTVISHRKNITEKLGIKSISGLTIYAIIHKIIDTDNIQVDKLI